MYKYVVEFIETNDRAGTPHSNFYKAMDSEHAKKLFLADVRKMGGRPSDVKIMSARRTYEEKHKNRIKFPSGTEEMMSKEWSR